MTEPMVVFTNDQPVEAVTRAAAGHLIRLRGYRVPMTDDKFLTCEAEGAPGKWAIVHLPSGSILAFGEGKLAAMHAARRIHDAVVRAGHDLTTEVVAEVSKWRDTVVRAVQSAEFEHVRDHDA